MEGSKEQAMQELLSDETLSNAEVQAMQETTL